MPYDPDLIGADVDRDLADFDTLDSLDATAADAAHSLATGYPIRP
ncbi:hypothetical protein [Actinopolymorpha pittospori]|uniref:Uncharacterized protein n=1 Tax=Actinopolymorpha pittospori TaxID=648752 RepID=A0A927MTT5_9ACTN|nr:hypothetical protein [Actinopolymorpha pittospori]MBE1606221.1 hypothetical protein [Actinopolymorpha pittospori]